MGLPGMVLSGISMVAGAIMYWAVTAQNSAIVQNHGFRLSTVGVILMVAGAVGFVVSLAVFMTSRRAPSGPTRTIDREVIDESGHASSLHEQQS